MAITQAFCNSAKQQFLTGSHTPLHTYKIALYTSAATLGATTTAYSATNETSGTGYTAGGTALVGFSSSMDTGVGFITFTTSPSWAAASFTANGAVIYNTSGSQAIAVLAFGQDYTATNGTFTVNFPAATSAAALIRLS
jgi:hypothetical protein